MSNIYENSPLKINFNIGIATTETSDIVLKYRKPYSINGDVVEGKFEESEFTDVGVTTPATGEVYTEVGNDILTPPGLWTFWSVVTETNGNITSGDPFTLPVLRRAGVAITNLSFVKDYLGITVDTNDNKIEALIPLFEQMYLDVRNAPWSKRYDETNDYLFPIYPIGSDVTIAEMIGYKISQGTSYDVLTSERIGSYNWTSDGKTSHGFPSSIMSQIKRFVKGA